jgi:hypothetical protein
VKNATSNNTQLHLAPRGPKRIVRLPRQEIPWYTNIDHHTKATLTDSPIPLPPIYEQFLSVP